MPILKTPEADIYYEIHGSGPPLVFLHGRGGDTRVWTEQVAYFKSRFTCVTFDHRSWGQSVGPLFEPWAEVFVHDLSNLLAHLNISAFDAVAQSMGGYTLRAFHQADISKLGRVVMSGTTGGFVPEIWRERMRQASEDAEHMRLLWRQGQGHHPALAKATYKNQPQRAAAYEAITRAAPRKAPSRSNQPTSPEPEHLLLPSQTVFVHGQDDTILPIEVVQAVAQLGHWPLYPIEGAGHAVYFEQPEAFNAVIDRFLK